MLDLNVFRSSTTQQGDHHESGVPEHVRGLVQGRSSAAPHILPRAFNALSVQLLPLSARVTLPDDGGVGHGREGPQATV